MKLIKELKIVSILLIILSLSACKKESLEEKEIPAPLVNYIVEDNSDIAKFEVNTDFIVDGKSVTFTPINRNYDYEYSWNFGNGDSSKYLSPTYTYDTVGVYTVSLTVTNDYVTMTEKHTITVNTSLGTVTDIEGNTYKTKIIGEQTWMIDNLKTTKYNDGTDILLINEDSLWGYSKTPAYCWYQNDKTNKEQYGALYNYYTVETGKLCPASWHVPLKEEWVALLDQIGEDSDEKAEYLLEDISLALGGRRLYDSYNYKDEEGFYWSSTESNTYTYYDEAYIMSLYGSTKLATSRFDRDYFYGLSVLCIKNSTF